MTEFCALRAKAYAYKLDDDTEMKKAKGTKKCIVKRELMFENYKDALFNDKIIIRSQQRFRSYNHKVYTEEVNKIALSSNDDKRTQTFDKVTTFPYGTNVFKECENEMLLKNKLNEFDEDIDIDNTMIEDIDNTMIEDIDNTMIEDTNIDTGNTMTKDIDTGNTMTEDIDIDKDKIEDIDTDIDIDKDKTEDIDKDKTGTKDKDKDNDNGKAITIYGDKYKDKDKTSTKDKGNTTSKTKKNYVR